MHNSRRSFLATASMAAAGNALGFRPFGMLNALAQTTTEYKALVCIFMFGGNDANNMLIPFDTAGYGNYSTVRGATCVAAENPAAAGAAAQLRSPPQHAGGAVVVQ